jgi:hypothetical protein
MRRTATRHTRTPRRLGSGTLRYVDNQTLSLDAYAKFIEDNFLGSQRLDPVNDERPDPRPDVRENASILGNLAADFEFNQSPRSPAPLSENPPPGAASSPGG